MTETILSLIAAAAIGFLTMLAFASALPPTPEEACAADPVACVILRDDAPPPPGAPT
jgi:hypothetical protein